MGDSGEFAAEFAEFVMTPIDAAVSADNTTEVILIRHGQTIPVKERDAAQMLDPPLSLLGREQAASTAASLRSAPVVGVYASEMGRSLETAEAIAQLHKLAVVRVPELSEVGVLQKLPSGKLLTDTASRSELTAAGQRFVETGNWDAFPVSEGSHEFRGRVRSAIGGIVARHDRGIVCVISHGGVINAYLAHVLGIERDYFFRPLNCSICRLGALRGGHVLVSLNEIEHLGHRIRTA